MLQDTVRGGNGMGGWTGTTAALTEWQQQGWGRGSTGWSALKKAVKMFGPAAITQELSKKLLKCHADVGRESKKCATFKIQAVEVAILRAIWGMVKGDAELKLFHSMVKYNDLFVPQNISGNVIAFMGGCPLEVRP